VTSSPQLTELVEAFAQDLSRTLTGFLGRDVDCGWNVNRDTGRILVEPTARAVVLEFCQRVILALRMAFDVHGAPGWQDVLAQGRATWRCTQSRAVARDCPSAAVAALTDLGSTVTRPDTGAVPDRSDRMTAL
jgi:hypothetical protein